MKIQQFVAQEPGRRGDRRDEGGTKEGDSALWASAPGSKGENGDSLIEMLINQGKYRAGVGGHKTVGGGKEKQ